jgi:hypothetical protein
LVFRFSGRIGLRRRRRQAAKWPWQAVENGLPAEATDGLLEATSDFEERAQALLAIVRSRNAREVRIAATCLST